MLHWQLTEISTIWSTKMNNWEKPLNEIKVIFKKMLNYKKATIKMKP